MDENIENNDSENEDEILYVRLSQITMDKNGVALIQDELNTRGIKFDENLRIRALKNVLSKKALDGEKEFEPHSSLIIQAVKDELI